MFSFPPWQILSQTCSKHTNVRSKHVSDLYTLVACSQVILHLSQQRTSIVFCVKTEHAAKLTIIWIVFKARAEYFRWPICFSAQKPERNNAIQHTLWSCCCDHCLSECQICTISFGRVWQAPPTQHRRNNESQHNGLLVSYEQRTGPERKERGRYN